MYIYDKIIMGGDIMQSDAQKKATIQYIKSHYDRITLQLPKGAKAILAAHASGRDRSVNAFISRAIVQAMQDDGADPANIAVICGR
jgi:hypothetical protein